jgi:type IV pilus assembly protein PilZ
MGIFVRSEEPLAKGTMLRLKFAPPGAEAFDLEGEVVWINPPRPDAVNPGMGIRFVHLTPDTRERLVELVRTIAYLHADEDPEAS